MVTKYGNGFAKIFKNGFAKIFKNSNRYRSENNFIDLPK